MQSDRPQGDAALIAAINSGAPVPTTEAQAKELDISKQRYFVDARVGCVAVRDRTLVVPDRQGLHPDMQCVVWYRSGEWVPKRCNECNHNHGGNYVVSDEAVAQAKAACDKFNSEDATSQPTPPAAPGEWHSHDERLGSYPYTVGKSGPMFRTDKPDDAKWLAQRLNRADAMERALKDINDLPFHATRADVFAIFMRYEAALRK